MEDKRVFQFVILRTCLQEFHWLLLLCRRGFFTSDWKAVPARYPFHEPHHLHSTTVEVVGEPLRFLQSYCWNVNNFLSSKVTVMMFLDHWRSNRTIHGPKDSYFWTLLFHFCVQDWWPQSLVRRLILGTVWEILACLVIIQMNNFLITCENSAWYRLRYNVNAREITTIRVFIANY